MSDFDLPRYRSLTLRQFTSVLTDSDRLLSSISNAKRSIFPEFASTWRELPLVKSPFDIALIQQLVGELKPKTILEFGSYAGGSALWLADICAGLQIDTQIVSFDIEPPTLEHATIKFDQIDLSNNKSIDTLIQSLSHLPRPWLILEDAHVNLKYLIPALLNAMSAGDYLIVEDTLDPEKHDALMASVTSFIDQVLVDTRYTDMFGYNGTFNANGYLVKR